MTASIDNKTKLNGWLKFIISAIVTVLISIGASLYTTSYRDGKNDNRIETLETKANKYEKDHDLLIQIDTKLSAIETLLKEQRQRGNEK